MCETMFLHFVPVDGIEYFSGIFWQERYVFMFLCFYVSRKQACGQGLNEIPTVDILHAYANAIWRSDVSTYKQPTYPLMDAINGRQ
jgi:hypothetical protein